MRSKLHQSRGKQPSSSVKVPKYSLSGKGCGVPWTSSMLAQKQPSFKECVIAHWQRNSAPTT